MRNCTSTITTETFAEIEDLAAVWGRTVDHTIRVLLRRGLNDALRMSVCRDCGCTEFDACIDDESGEPCSWAVEDLCSACAATNERNPR